MDGAEGACATNITQKQRLIPHDEWEKQRPYRVMIHIDYWTEIKKSWKKVCRYAGEDCNVQLESMDSVIRGLDDLIKKIAEAKK